MNKWSKGYMVILLLSAGGLAGCQASFSGAPSTATRAVAEVLPSPTQPESPSEAAEPVIVYHRSGGFAGIDEEWSIYLDGRVLASDGRGFRVEAGQVTALLGSVEDAGFFDVDDIQGRVEPCPDCFTYEITARSEGRSLILTVADGPTQLSPEVTQTIQALNAFLATLSEG